MGTVVDIKLWGVDDETAHLASAEISQLMNSVNDRWHAWHPSLLTQLNDKLRRGETAALDPETYALLVDAQQLSKQSEGLFDPGIGNLLKLWGFENDEQPVGPPPSAQERSSWLAKNEGIANLILENNTARLVSGETQFDLGGYAKGYAVDLAIERLKGLGIRNAIVTAGGDLRAIGGKGEKPWRIGVRDPRSPDVFASIDMKEDESVHTSGDYERFYMYEGQRYSHLLDPRSGAPETETASVTIIHNNGASADAAATALCIAGPKDWAKIAKQMGLDYVMLIDVDGQIYLTPQMEKRVTFLNEPKVKPIIQSL